MTRLFFVCTKHLSSVRSSGPSQGITRCWSQQQRFPFSSKSSWKSFLEGETAQELSGAATTTVRLLSAFGVVHIVSEYGFELTKCEGPSMMPTIRPAGEIILVERFTHRLFGFSNEKKNENGGTRWDVGVERCRVARSRQQRFHLESDSDEDDIPWHEPKQTPVNSLSNRSTVLSRWWDRMTSGVQVGDVVVLQHPHRDGTVCKRVLGLPGDVVVRPRHQRFPWEEDYAGGEEHRRVMDLFQELDDELDEEEDRGSHSPSLSNSSLLVVPDGHVWVEGDNSINSSDSRTYGPLPASLVVGKVLCRVWPPRGAAMMERGGRPLPPPGQPFTGSTVLPAGYEGEPIVSDSFLDRRRRRRKKRDL